VDECPIDLETEDTTWDIWMQMKDGI
jgi:hypothetical protein